MSQSYAFYKTLLSIRDQIPLFVLLTYGLGNIVLNGLNVFWFYKMIAAVRKRMKPSPSPKAGKNNANGKALNGKKLN